MVFTLTGCASVSAIEPKPITTTTIEAPRIGEAVITVSVTQTRGPNRIYCIDGTQYEPEITQIVLWSDGRTTTDIIVPFDCHPWPLTCQDGTTFVPPTVLAGGVTQCLAWGKPLFSWYVHLLGLPEIFITAIIPRESGWNPDSRNGYDCRGLTQQCGKRSVYQMLGYTWDDAFDPWVNLLVAKHLYDVEDLRPWTCSRCSLHV
jgi:hypothetical protein